MLRAIIYHNPRCSKSRQALAYLNNKEISITIIDCVKNPPSQHQLTELLSQLALPAIALVRTNDRFFKSLNIDINSLNTAAIITLLVEHPQLLQRPIITINNKAVIGRPTEKILEIL